MSKERRSAYAAKRGTAPQPQVGIVAKNEELDVFLRIRDCNLSGLTVEDRAQALYLLAASSSEALSDDHAMRRMGILLAVEVLFPDLCQRINGGKPKG